MFTWYKLYKSVPYETVVKGLSVDTVGPRPGSCDEEGDRRAEQSAGPDEQEKSHGS